MSPFTCPPDAHLSETHLAALFEDFHQSMNSGQSEAAIFSSVVNNVRLVYLGALFKAQEHMLARGQQDSSELAQLRRERSAAPPVYRSENAQTGPAYDTERAAPTYDVAHAPLGGNSEPAPLGQARKEEEIIWPARRFPLHIGSYSVDHRRDMACWGGMDKEGWTERMQFNVYKYQEAGTIKLEVTEQSGSHRIMVNGTGQGWKHRLAFYAYDKPRPGTVYIWVAFRADPDRCLFLKGKPSDTLEGWERTLEFWVPKQ